MSIDLYDVPFNEIGMTVRGQMHNQNKNTLDIPIMLVVGFIGAILIYKLTQHELNDKNR